jgi:hypothetical protein
MSWTAATLMWSKVDLQLTLSMAVEDPVEVRLYMHPSWILPPPGDSAPAASFFSKGRVEGEIFVSWCRDP